MLKKVAILSFVLGFMAYHIVFAQNINSAFVNVTPKHEENVREVIKSCMMDFNNAKIDFSRYVIPNKIFKAKRNP